MPYVTVSVYMPNGATYFTGTCYSSSMPACAFGMHSLPSTGNLTRVTDREGQVSGYGYDFLNRRTSAGFGATIGSPTSYANTVAYTWDAGDRMTQVVDSVSGTIAQSFDGMDRLTQEQTPQGQIDYTYYPNGLRQTMTVQGQAGIGYSYDNLDRLTQIAQGSVTVALSYDSINRRSTLTLPSGVQVNYAYDEANQLTGLTYQNGSTPLGNLSYGYDMTGRRVSVGGTLAQANLPAAVTSTSYDAANRLTAWGGHVISYDDNGALTTDAASSTLNYTWDARGRMTQIQDGSTTIASFQYDAFNRRTGKTVNGVSRNFLHDDWQIVQELNGSTPTANLLTGLGVDENFRRTAGSTVEDFLTDALGSTIALTDASGAIQTSYSYEPYGATAASGSTGNAYQYTGRENDGALYYYRNRYYSPGFQRFISEDPIGLKGGVNIYAYVRGNPISLLDPSGLSPAGPGSFPPPSGGKKGSGQCDDYDDCEAQAEADEAVCRQLKDAAVRERCWSSANERFGACRAKRPLPPLVTWKERLPDPRPVPPSPAEPAPPPPGTTTAVGGVLLLILIILSSTVGST